MADERPRHERESGRAEALTRAGEDRRGWGRATIRFLTHPLHPFPKIESTDLLLPNRQGPLRLAGDCAIVGLAFAILAYFPLLLVALATPHHLGNWFWWTTVAIGVAGGVYVFLRAWTPDTRDLDRF
jgi:hypothetical protein